MALAPYSSHQAEQPRPLVSLASTASLTAAVHCQSRDYEGWGHHLFNRLAVSCSGEIADTRNITQEKGGSTNNESSTVTTLEHGREVRIYSQGGISEMGNLRHPADVSIEDFAFLRRDMERDFIEDDGVICKTEKGILIQFDIAVERLRRQRGLERGFDLLMKQEGVPTRYTKEVFSEIGISLVPDKPLDAA